MDFYFNHNKIQKDIEAAKGSGETPAVCKEFANLVSNLKESNGGICLLKSWRNDVQLNCSEEPRKYLALFMALQQTKDIDEIDAGDILKAVEIEPNMSSVAARTVLSCCVRDEKDAFISTVGDCEVSEKEYEILATRQKIGNLCGLESALEYQIYHPMPHNIHELFDKVHNDHDDIVFTKKAYDTAQERQSAYRKFGFEKMLKIFHGIKELLLPYYNGMTEGISEPDIFDTFYEKYGVKVSPETDETLKMYGELRDITINGVKYRMTNHIKIPVQKCRIHFIDINGKIYVGHSGGHLRTFNDR